MLHVVVIAASFAHSIAADSAPANANAAHDMSAFAALPEDPPPKEIVRGQHYWVSNEERPEIFRDDLEKAGPGGVYVGVGAEQNFVFAGWLRPDVMVLMDFDEAIPDLHRAFASAFKRCETKEDFVQAFALDKQAQMLKWLREDYPDLKQRTRIVEALKDGRGPVKVHAERIKKGFISRGVKTYLNDDDDYAFVRNLYLQNRVFILRGDLTAKKAVRAIGDAAKRAALPVRAVYLSNAEQYFGYNEDFRQNILSLPFDEKGLVLRTISVPRWGYAKDSNSYHYNVEGGLSFQSYVADPATTSVATVLDAAPRKDGISRLFTPPTHAPAPPASPATDAIPLAPIAPVELADAPKPIECGTNGDVDVDGMACVPGGPFLRGTDDWHKLSENARPQMTVWVQTFYMDKNEVTYAQYKECEKAGACKHAGPNYVDFDAPAQPITGVSWFDARDYCTWKKKRLPTESEWEKAARGTDGRAYPWGNQEATCARAVIMTDAGRSCGKKQRSTDFADVGRPEPVGSKPAGVYGLFDMAGNAQEWVADWFSPSWSACGKDCAGVDPKGPCGGADVCPGHDEKVVRGGSWYWPAPYATTFHRRAHTPANAPVFHHFGFRCAQSATRAVVDGAKGYAGASNGRQ